MRRQSPTANCSGRLSRGWLRCLIDPTGGTRYVLCVGVLPALESSAGIRTRRVLHVALVGALVAGVETNFKNVSAVAAAQPGLRTLPVPVRPYRDDMLERLGAILPSSVRGTLRSVAGTLPLFTTGRLDGVWTQIDVPLLPWMLTWNAFRRIPIVYTADSTPIQARQFKGLYGDWALASPAKQHLRDILHGICLRRCTAVTALTEWAARSMRDDYGVDPARLHVIPPGVDVSFWTPPESRSLESRPVRILFVGGDYHRKGGDVLLEVFRQRLRSDAEVHFVTRSDAIRPEPGVFLHTGLGPNDLRLRDLYRAADLFVLPTRADCFSIAGLEAMASGLPVVTCPVGGVSELFEDGVQGVYVPPGDPAALAEALTSLVGNPERRLRMGEAARRLTVERYDVRVNTSRLFDLFEAVA